ncbi:DUF4130 domain-containing protein, partial [Coprococcus eutactus]|uniref:DUF4130 domain-containing protein n=1 Tax=Coprococcus eutactus TaxID=33043 RepID=UPI002109593F
MILAFKVGKVFEHMLIIREVMCIMELVRIVSNESLKFREMTRFTSVDRKVYVRHIEPRCDVWLLVAGHFA